MNNSTKVITYSGLLTALAIVLNQFPLFSMPWGGSVTLLSMFFITLVGWLFGTKAGITAGVALGLIDLALGGFIMHPAQVLLDYPLAFGALGISGFFKEHKHGLYLGYVAGCLGRWFFVFLSGWLFFYIWAPEGWNYALYSAVYNIAYIGIEMLITLVAIALPPVRHMLESVKSRLYIA